MYKIDFTFIVSILGLLSSGIALFFYSDKFRLKEEKKGSSSVIKYIPLFLVVFTLAVVLILDRYYENQNAKERASLIALKNERFNLNVDSLTSKEKVLLIDSLLIYKSKLADIIDRLEKQKRVIGKGNNAIDQARLVLNKTDYQIADIQSYNEIIDIPENYTNQYFDVRSNMEFDCPSKSSSTYVDVDLRFENKKLVNSIRCIYVSVTEKTTTPNNVNLVWQQAYAVKLGLNKIRMRNYFNNPKIRIEIGYFLKTDSTKKTPSFYFASCGAL